MYFISHLLFLINSTVSHFSSAHSTPISQDDEVCDEEHNGRYIIVYSVSSSMYQVLQIYVCIIQVCIKCCRDMCYHQVCIKCCRDMCVSSSMYQVLQIYMCIIKYVSSGVDMCYHQVCIKWCIDMCVSSSMYQVV